MHKYCKAYYLKDLRQSSAWTEKHDEQEPELSDDDVVYLWDDFTVVRSPIIPDKGLIFTEITPEWRNFCEHVLMFTIPEDLRYAYTSPEQTDKASAETVNIQDTVSA